MRKSTGILIRPFDGSRHDAEGMLTVERATFHESPYTAMQLQAMLTVGPQRAWLAVQGTAIAGFVVAFLVTGLRGCWWEIDLLGVHPDWRGHHLGSRLIQAATAYGASLAGEARAVVADDNGASQRAFLRAGFRAAPGACNLLIYRPLAASAIESRPAHEGVVVRETPVAAGLTLMVAESSAGGEPTGRAELIEVQTILYHGVWIESLRARDDTVREVLIRRAVDWIRDAGLDEIGAMLPEVDGPLERALLAAGFWSLGRFRWLGAALGQEGGFSARGGPVGRLALAGSRA